MIKQRANLLLSLPWKPKSLVSIKSSLIIIVLWVVLLSIISILIYWRSSSGQMELSSLVRKKSELEKEVFSIQQQVNQLEKQKSLSPTEMKVQKEFLLPQSFSHYMIGLAQGVPKGLWLTDIEIDQGLRKFRLEGYSLSKKMITEFLRFLGKTPSFRDVPFKAIEINKETDKDRQKFHFVLSAEQ